MVKEGSLRAPGAIHFVVFISHQREQWEGKLIGWTLILVIRDKVFWAFLIAVVRLVLRSQRKNTVRWRTVLTKNCLIEYLVLLKLIHEKHRKKYESCKFLGKLRLHAIILILSIPVFRKLSVPAVNSNIRERTSNSHKGGKGLVIWQAMF